MPSVEFSDTYRNPSWGTYPTNYIRIDYTETQYDAANNRTQIRLDGVYARVDTGSPITIGSSTAKGNLYFGGTNILSIPGTSTYQVNLSSNYGLITYTNTGATTWISHDTYGNGSMTVKLSDGWTSGSTNYFGLSHITYGIFGIRTDASKSVSLTSHASVLTVNPNGGIWNNSSSSQNFTQRYTTTKTIANPTRNGYTFLGWSLTGSGSLSGTTYTFADHANGTLTANWQLITYTVSYDANGGSGAPASQTKTYGTPLILSNVIPTRTGYSFVGWATSASATVAEYQAGGTFTTNANTTLYAVWKLLEYTLTTDISALGVTVNIQRGGVNLHNGDTLYYGDNIVISWSVSSGYVIDAFEVNGVDISGSNPTTISGITEDQFVQMLVKTGAVVYITNDQHQIYIYDGANWDQYQAYIYNGATWDTY